MTLFKKFNAIGIEKELPRQLVPYIGGRMASLRGTFLLYEDNGKQVVMEISADDAAYFEKAVTNYDPYNDAATALAALDAAEILEWKALRWQRNGKRKIHEGPPRVEDRYGEERFLPW